MLTDYDLVVIGGGAGGLTAAGMGALLGASTMLIERARLGGECTWTGCVPSKSLIRAASIAHTLQHSADYGFAPLNAQVSFPRVMERLRNVQQQIYEENDAPPNLEKLGVEVNYGSAAFIDSNTIRIGERRIRARFFVIATGSNPRTLRFEAPVLTNDSIFRLTELPARLAIVGAGPMGMEMAQAFGRLGSKVTVVASGSEILPNDDQELATLLRKHLETEGVQFLRGVRATAGSRSGSETILSLSDGQNVTCDAVFSAIGRQVQTDGLELNAAGVQTSPVGIIVDKHCRTTCPHIYAVGDVTGWQPFTHMAEHMAKVAITNALLRWPASVDDVVPWCTFTSPEIAHTGCRTDQLEFGGSTVLRYPVRQVDRALIDGQPDGLIKVAVNRFGRVMGASILAPGAGELINVWSLALRRRMRVQDVSDTIHPYPTYSLGARKAADRWNHRWLDSRLLALLGRLLGYRGVRRGSDALGTERME